MNSGDFHITNHEKDNNIILFPDFQKLRDEVEQLRIELSNLVLERDELLLVQCKNIEMEYMLKLGSLEYKAYETQCSALRLKRKIDLIQGKLNRQDKIIISQIEEILNAEFLEFQEKLNAQVEKMNDAINRNDGQFISDEDSKELKKIYRKLVKILHPDLNPQITDALMKLFNNAVSAYENGDLATLRIIDEMIGDHPLPDEKQDATTQLVTEKDRLIKILNTVKESIDKIKSEYPYTVKDIIEHPQKIEDKKQELENIIAEYKELIEVYTKHIEEMLR